MLLKMNLVAKLGTIFMMLLVAASGATYDSVDELWEGIDPRMDPLEVETMRESVDDGIVSRTVFYTAETVNGFKVRVIAYYGFPVGGKDLPAILHLHGGGQNAMNEYVRFWAKRGYAVLSINWGGRPLEGIEANGRTDWGPLRYHQNSADSANVYNVVPHTRSNSWFHWALAARRGLTFLEQQSEVDETRLGLFGISMGGQLTWLVAGTDQRLRCAASVFGLARLHEPLPGIVNSEYQISLRDKSLWRKTLDPAAYAPRVKCPLLFLSSTNDIHARLDMLDRTMRAVPGPTWRVISPHENHRVRPGEGSSLEMWFDRWLKDGPAWPETPEVSVDVKNPAGIPQATVTPTNGRTEVNAVTLYYSTDPYPASRFWRTVVAHQDGEAWTADLPLTEIERGLYVLATVTHRSGLILSSPLRHLSAAELSQAGAKATDRPTLIIDDFSGGIADWFNFDTGANVLLSDKTFYEVSHHGGISGITWRETAGTGWKFFTRKVGDPKWRGPPRAKLQLTLYAAQKNTFVVVISSNYARPPQSERILAATVPVQGGRVESVLLTLADFRDVHDGTALTTWEDVNLLALAARHEVSGKNQGRPDRILGGDWSGPPPLLTRIEWLEL